MDYRMVHCSGVYVSLDEVKSRFGSVPEIFQTCACGEPATGLACLNLINEKLPDNWPGNFSDPKAAAIARSLRSAFHHKFELPVCDSCQAVHASEGSRYAN